MDSLSKDTEIKVVNEIVYVPAPPWKRFAAFFIDTILITGTLYFFVTVIEIIIVIIYGGIDIESIVKNKSFNGIILLVFMITAFFYYSLMESSTWKATIGKKILQIFVVDYNGGKIGFWRACLRVFGKYVTNMCLFLGYLLIFFTKDYQALYDFIARTLVVEIEDVENIEDDKKDLP